MAAVDHAVIADRIKVVVGAESQPEHHPWHLETVQVAPILAGEDLHPVDVADAQPPESVHGDGAGGAELPGLVPGAAPAVQETALR
jgi:hypothetical protein